MKLGDPLPILSPEAKRTSPQVDKEPHFDFAHKVNVKNLYGYVVGSLDFDFLVKTGRTFRQFWPTKRFQLFGRDFVAATNNHRWNRAGNPLGDLLLNCLCFTRFAGLVGAERVCTFFTLVSSMCPTVSNMVPPFSFFPFLGFVFHEPGKKYIYIYMCIYIYSLMGVLVLSSLATSTNQANMYIYIYIYLRGSWFFPA